MRALNLPSHIEKPFLALLVASVHERMPEANLSSIEFYVDNSGKKSWLCFWPTWNQRSAWDQYNPVKYSSHFHILMGLDDQNRLVVEWDDDCLGRLPQSIQEELVELTRGAVLSLRLSGVSLLPKDDEHAVA